MEKTGEVALTMPTRMAAIVSLIVFAVCLLVGGIEVDNPFETAVLRAIKAMACAFVIGLAAGKAAQLMLKENVTAVEQQLEVAAQQQQVSEPTETGKQPTIKEVG